MRRKLRLIAATLALASMASNAWAAGAGCVQPQDATALKVAAVQQELMVAALSCDAINLYNQFVTSYQNDLQASDRALQRFFRRLNPRTGTSDYHSFKTKLANSSSIKSVGDMRSFCDEAREVYRIALDATEKRLVSFLSAQPYVVEERYAACNFRIIVAEDNAAPAVAPLPRTKPSALVLASQGMAFRPSMGLNLEL